jgi:hypothetical protein
MTLHSFQREANKRFGLTAKRTLGAAQALYEKHKYITFPVQSHVIDFRSEAKGQQALEALPEPYHQYTSEALNGFVCHESRTGFSQGAGCGSSRADLRPVKKSCWTSFG